MVWPILGLAAGLAAGSEVAAVGLFALGCVASCALSTRSTLRVHSILREVKGTIPSVTLQGGSWGGISSTALGHHARSAGFDDEAINAIDGNLSVMVYSDTASYTHRFFKVKRHSGQCAIIDITISHGHLTWYLVDVSFTITGDPTDSVDSQIERAMNRLMENGMRSLRRGGRSSRSASRGAPTTCPRTCSLPSILVLGVLASARTLAPLHMRRQGRQTQRAISAPPLPQQPWKLKPTAAVQMPAPHFRTAFVGHFGGRHIPKFRPAKMQQHSTPSFVLNSMANSTDSPQADTTPKAVAQTIDVLEKLKGFQEKFGKLSYTENSIREGIRYRSLDWSSTKMFAKSVPEASARRFIEQKLRGMGVAEEDIEPFMCSAEGNLQSGAFSFTQKPDQDGSVKASLFMFEPAPGGRLNIGYVDGTAKFELSQLMRHERELGCLMFSFKWKEHELRKDGYNQQELSAVQDELLCRLTSSVTRDDLKKLEGR